MGKGDRRTKKGKIFQSSNGKTRPKPQAKRKRQRQRKQKEAAKS